MRDLKTWLDEQRLTVRDFALDLDAPLKTAQDWVYRGVTPSAENQDKISEYIMAHCAHHWVIAVPNGPISDGVCQRCGSQREFQNSAPDIRWPASKPPGKSTSGAPTQH